MSQETICSVAQFPGIVCVSAQIMENGKAYEMEGDVYFSVDSFPDYLRLSGRKLDNNLAGARVAFDTRKRNPADFALWKVSSMLYF